jgi:hypothetical protein
VTAIALLFFLVFDRATMLIGLFFSSSSPSILLPVPTTTRAMKIFVWAWLLAAPAITYV